MAEFVQIAPEPNNFKDALINIGRDLSLLKSQLENGQDANAQFTKVVGNIADFAPFDDAKILLENVFQMVLNYQALEKGLIREDVYIGNYEKALRFFDKTPSFMEKFGAAAIDNPLIGFGAALALTGGAAAIGAGANALKAGTTKEGTTGTTNLKTKITDTVKKASESGLLQKGKDIFKQLTGGGSSVQPGEVQTVDTVQGSTPTQKIVTYGLIAAAVLFLIAFLIRKYKG